MSLITISVQNLSAAIYKLPWHYLGNVSPSFVSSPLSSSYSPSFLLHLPLPSFFLFLLLLLLLYFQVTSLCTQRLLQGLCSGIISGSAQNVYGVPKIKQEMTMCKTSELYFQPFLYFVFNKTIIIGFQIITLYK